MSELRRLRVKRGYAQKDMAQLAGVTLQQYQKYEYGTSVPNVITALRLAAVLGTTAELLFGDW